MGCNCMQATKKRLNYDNVKRLAQKYAIHQGKMVVIYLVEPDVYGFMEADCPEAQKVNPVEYLSGLQ